MTAVEVERALGVAETATGPDLVARLRRDILARRVRVGVIGLGYVGLPLAAAFAGAGYDVLGFDADAARVTAVNAGTSPIADVPADRLLGLVEDGFLQSTDEPARLAEMDAISICVPTPLGKTRDPDISHVVEATRQVARSLRRGQLIVLESTTYPGTTREVLLPLLEETGLRAGVDFFLAFSPERIDPGNREYDVRNTPKVVGGLDAASTALAALLYRQAIETVVTVSSPEAAEMVKLLENTFRAVNIALANETALMCDRLGLDVWEVIAAAATKPFGFMPFYPGPGIGGHCIPLDPLYLSWKLRTLDYRARFIELADEINGAMPGHVVGRVTDGLNRFARSVNGARVLVLGVAYKPDVDDTRESPAVDVIRLLRGRGARVAFSDPHVPALSLDGAVLRAEPLTAEALDATDCVVIVTDHRAFDYALVLRHARLIVDTRNALRGRPAGGATVIRL